MGPSAEDAAGPRPRWAIRCHQCEALLAHDQRYCVECGARRGPLPAAIAALIGLPTPPARGSAPPELAPDRTPAPEEEAAPGPWRLDGVSAPAPSIAAVAVIALLAFGGFLGSAVPPRDPSGAARPLLVPVP